MHLLFNLIFVRTSLIAQSQQLLTYWRSTNHYLILFTGVNKNYKYANYSNWFMWIILRGVHTHTHMSPHMKERERKILNFVSIIFFKTAWVKWLRVKTVWPFVETPFCFFFAKTSQHEILVCLFVGLFSLFIKN